MAVTETLTPNMVERVLKASDWSTSWDVDSDGDFNIRFKEESSLGGMLCFFGVFSETKLKCWAAFSTVVPANHIPAALYLCNEYNHNYQRPTAYLEISVKSKPSTAYLCCQSYFSLETGIHFEGLQNFMTGFVAGCAVFEKWVIEQPRYWR